MVWRMLACILLLWQVNAHAETLPLVQAFELDDLDAFEQALAAGSDPNIRLDGPTDRPLLMQAIFDGKHEFVRALLDAGADPDITDTQGNSVMGVAVASGHGEIVRWLIEAGADFEKTTTRTLFGRDILDSAITSNIGDEVLVLLLKHDLPYAHATPGEHSSLCTVARERSYEVFRTFIEHAAEHALAIDSAPPSGTASPTSATGRRWAPWC
ncbi:hypothetical protein CAI21_21315 [Alkalilimnicola ehrlichii]|uniref:Uncharacterized protein n=1 Tax=Alkalilimnicola ehrlichii TaxID=351052 RepID=A0A3E0WJN1_9GAMM|nr:ankyrin repeat domain-containing protein [Alkalilimnicola ehrlichii]RFA24532.1 hypothetical protein CAI21_21315 [Alkalilimnicola ehrlichii]RFA32176.1 hypothetical protein CAL65_20360 [Alkalilimnicola ehrlichii]